MSDNLTLYNAVRVVPAEAQKEIKGGRLSGMTDINPMWRIKALTEQFGICGVGWWFEVTDKRLEAGGNNQIAAFVDINLYVKIDGEWSKPIPGTGGSMFVANESKGLHTSDECFKMAQTDAISVACKALGFGADIYWQKDKTKYNGVTETFDSTPAEEIQITDEDMPASFKKAEEIFSGEDSKPAKYISENQQKRLFALAGYKENKDLAKEIVQKLLDKHDLKSTKEIRQGDEYKEICEDAQVMLAKLVVK